SATRSPQAQQRISPEIILVTSRRRRRLPFRRLPGPRRRLLLFLYTARRGGGGRVQPRQRAAADRPLRGRRGLHPLLGGGQERDRGAGSGARDLLGTGHGGAVSQGPGQAGRAVEASLHEQPGGARQAIPSGAAGRVPGGGLGRRAGEQRGVRDHVPASVLGDVGTAGGARGGDREDRGRPRHVPGGL
ncbi:unnamed protein product, partial [Ectocarpus fasciculatus]